MASDYETIIGLEVHAQLLTKSKIFCACSTRFGAPPNTQTCPICVGMPGVLPVLNREVVEMVLKTSLATHCRIAPFCRFARKNYFYPDLPKNYQISQYELPLAEGGYINIESDGAVKRISLIRIHMEEDAGKLFHGENFGDPDKSYVDFNRTGVPLMEIVSAPDIRSPKEARDYLLKLKTILEYLEVCSGNMEEGSFRCDANISVRRAGQSGLGVKTEVKNMNSFKNVQRALEYEALRQMRILDEGGQIVQETRLWDAKEEITLPMRSKEEAHDYRYFPEPDLVPIMVDEEWMERVRRSLPELPDDRKTRFEVQYGLPPYDAAVLTSYRALADFFEDTTKLFPKPKIVSNWIMGEVLREAKRSDEGIDTIKTSPSMLAELLKAIDEGLVSGKLAKEVFNEMSTTGASPMAIIKEKGLVQISDEAEIEKLIEETLRQNEEQVKQYRAGKTKLFGFFVGEVMKASTGKANPQLVGAILKRKLEG